jgi:hypothetical protein
MRCFLCNQEIGETGEKFMANPLCQKGNFKSNCCASCMENFVRPANRLMGGTSVVTNREPMEGDKLILFFVSNEGGEERIRNKLLENVDSGDIFTSGIVEGTNASLSSIDTDLSFRGSWGNFPVKLSDSFINLGSN